MKTRKTKIYYTFSSSVVICRIVWDLIKQHNMLGVSFLPPILYVFGNILFESSCDNTWGGVGWAGLGVITGCL